MKAIKAYAKFLKKKLAYDAILKDLHEQVVLELHDCEDGHADALGVEFHLTNKVEKEFSAVAEKQMKELKDQIALIKEQEIAAGRVVATVKQSFDASIPRSFKDKVLAEVSDYKNYFNL